MTPLKKTIFRISGTLVVLAALALAGCAGPKYTAAPPSEKLSYMGIKFEKDLYGGLWYGPNYQAPRLVVAPRVPASE